MKPNDIAELISEDIDFNNGLLLENIADSYKTTIRQFNSIDGPITINDDDHNTIESIYNSQKTQINTVFNVNPKLCKGINALNDLAFSKWVSKEQIAVNSRQYVNDIFKEEEISINNIIWGCDEWKVMGKEMLERLSATDVRRFKEWSACMDLFKGVLQEIQELQNR